MVSILCPFISLEVTTWSGELWLKEGEARRVSGWSPVLLPSCLPSTRPLPGAFFPVSFPAINSGVSPRSGSSQEQEEASPYGRLKQHPPLPGEEAERAFSCLSSTPLGQLPQAEVSASFTMRYLSPVLHPLYLRASSRISREAVWPVCRAFYLYTSFSLSTPRISPPALSRMPMF